MARTVGRRFMISAGVAGLVGLAAVAMAQPSAMPGAGMMGGAGPGMMGGVGTGMMGGGWNTASYLDALKTRLGITAEEEPAWKEYADTISGVQEQMRGLHQTMFEAMGTATWQERQSMMNQVFQARQQAFDVVHEAAEKLLAALPPGQKTVAQDVLPGLGYGPGMMHWRGP